MKDNVLWKISNLAICLLLTCCNVFIEPECVGTLQQSIQDPQGLADIHPYGDYTVFLDNSSACSGVLITHNVVLTAGHCINGKRYNVTLPYARCEHQFRYAIDSYSSFQSNGSVNLNHLDIGLLALDKPFNLDFLPTLYFGPQLKEVKVITVGRNNTNNLTYDLWYFVQNLTLEGKYYWGSKATQPGDSGGPSFVYNTSVLVGITSGGGKGASVISTLNEEEIVSFVNKHGGFTKQPIK